MVRAWGSREGKSVGVAWKVRVWGGMEGKGVGWHGR